MKRRGGLINFPASNHQDSDPAQRGQKPYQSMPSVFSVVKWNVTRQRKKQAALPPC